MAKKYIDADRLCAEIERLKGQLIRGACSAQIEMETNCKDEAYNEVLTLIDSLQQEQTLTDCNELQEPEVDLEKEIEEYWIATGWSKIMTLGKFKVIARYFYGLGQLNAK